MEIVEWTFDDAEEISNLELKIFKDPWSLYAVADGISAPAFRGYSVKEQGKIIAYYSFYAIPPEAHIANVAVVAENRGKGLADMMMQDLFERAKPLGIDEFTLEVRPSNTKALNLYEKYGFKQEGLRKRYYGDGEDAIIMWKRK
ncbi:MAG: ribosomal protein S18-alanine N-acetyltransferase [Clostridia bacterium]